MKKYVFESLKFFCAAILCTILSAFATPSWGANCNLLPIQSDKIVLGRGFVGPNFNDNGTNFYLDYYIPVQPNTTYTFSASTQLTNVKFGEFTSNKDFINRLFSQDVSAYTFTTSENTQYLLMGANINNSNIESVNTVLAINWQLELGDTATEYVPYNPNCGCNGTVVNYVSATGTGVQSGTPTPTNPIEPVFYQQGNMVLRKVGDYADTYDATTGKITSRVGVAVLDGTEDWRAHNSIAGWFQLSEPLVYGGIAPALCTHYPYSSSQGGAGVYFSTGRSNPQTNRIIIADDINFPRTGMLAEFKQYLAQQYAAGTPVTIYYPLAEETTEDWPASYCETPIKIATTKYNETKFSPLNAALANAISVVDSVVSNTITQAGRIADLQAQKQTRPADDPSDANNAENCPAGKKCLLVEDATGVPHWYEIVESAYGLPSGYTALEYIQSDRASYLIVPYRVNNKTVFYCRYNEIQNGPQTANAVFGVTTSPDVLKANNGILRLTGSNFNRMGWGNYVEGCVISVNAPKEFNTWYEVLYDQNKLYQNDRLYATSATEPSTSWVAEYDLGVFARNSESVTMPAIAKISSVWAKENGEYKINLIPVKRNSDGVLGMYDTVSGEFFTNKGSGSFIAGDPVVE